MKFTDLTLRIPQHVIIAGNPFSGKSTLVSKLAEAGFKLLWFSLDGKHSVLNKLSQKAKENIEIIVLPDTKDFPVAIDTMKKVLTKVGDHNICDRHGQIDCSVCKKDNLSFSIVNLYKIANDPEYIWIVVIDNISQLADSAENLARKAGKLKDDEKTEWDHYNHYQFLMKSCLSAIQASPFNVICTAHLTESEMDDGKKMLVPMVGSTVYSRKVGGYFDHCLFLEIVNMSHRGASSSTFRASVLTGSTLDIKLEDMKEPSLVPFFNGTIKKLEQQADVQRSKEILTGAGNAKEGPISVADSAPYTSSITPIPVASNMGGSTDRAAQPDVPKLPEAGVASNMHVGHQTPSDAATAALARLKGLRK